MILQRGIKVVICYLLAVLQASCCGVIALHARCYNFIALHASCYAFNYRQRYMQGIMIMMDAGRQLPPEESSTIALRVMIWVMVRVSSYKV